MSEEKARILVIGAHPDDAEAGCGGTAALWCKKGFTVRLVSATNGQTGHYEQGGVTLTQRRIAEAKAAAELIGAESQVLPIPNGGIEPNLIYRSMFIRLIREFNPDLILTHRPNDYHPDHRYTSQLVQDSSYVVTVPNNCPEVPALKKNPSVMYLCDGFTKPYPHQGDIVIDIDSVAATKIEMAHQHTSQMYEWLPYNAGQLDQVPAGEDQRRKWLFERRMPGNAKIADRFRDRLVARYGEGKGRAVKHAEAFEICEYGGALTDEKREWLFGGL